MGTYILRNIKITVCTDNYSCFEKYSEVYWAKVGSAVPIPIYGQLPVIGAVFCSCSYLILYLIVN
jgi:hypothetical protein